MFEAVAVVVITSISLHHHEPIHFLANPAENSSRPFNPELHGILDLSCPRQHFAVQSVRQSSRCLPKSAHLQQWLP